jgi:hypothetical protein
MVARPTRWRPDRPLWYALRVADGTGVPKGHSIEVNRAPVLTLWAAVVAERMGFDRDEALSLGRAVAGLNAYAKGVRLGLFTASAPKKVAEQKKALRRGQTLQIDMLGRAVPTTATPDGLRALSKAQPVSPESVARYLDGKFGEALPEVSAAMERLARSLPPEPLAAEAFHLYERFRPEVPAGVKGWGVKGTLDIGRILALAK